MIPSEINGKKVTVIGEKAFDTRKDIKHVIISEGVTTIKSLAFNFCECLESVQLPKGIQIIELFAFPYCYNLKEINFPDTLKEIGLHAFDSCKIEKIKLPNKLSIYGSSAFFNCKNLSEAEFTDGTKYIDLSILWYCDNLSKIIIPNSVNNIEGYFAEHTGNINAVIYANSNSYARIYANQNNLKFKCLNTHDWDKGTITNQPNAIRDGIKTYTCTACKTTKTEKVPKLGLPRKGKTITETKSNNTYKVTKSETKNGTVEFAKVRKSTSSITIPDTVTVDGVTYKVTSISKNAFKNNKNLKKVTIGKNITKINVNTFYGCKNLKTITIKSTNLKSVGKNVFKGINAKAKIKVPKSKLKFYKKLFAKKGQKSTVKIVK